MRKLDLRAHEVIARAFLEKYPQGCNEYELFVEMSYKLYHEWKEEADGIAIWNDFGMFPETEQSEILRKYRDKFWGKEIRVICSISLKGDELRVFDEREIEK